MAQLTTGEKESLARQGAFGCTLRCDNPTCGKPVLQPIIWKGKGGKSDYCTRECRDQVEGRTTKLKSKYKDGSTSFSYVPLLGTNVDAIEQQIMAWIIVQPMETWNFNTIVTMLKGTDRSAIRKAINNLLDEQTLYRVGRTMTISKPDVFVVEQKEHRREEQKLERFRKRKKRMKEKQREKESRDD